MGSIQHHKRQLARRQRILTAAGAIGIIYSVSTVTSAKAESSLMRIAGNCVGLSECLFGMIFQDPEVRLLGRWKGNQNNISWLFAPGGTVEIYDGEKRIATGSWGKIRAWPQLGKIDIQIAIEYADKPGNKTSAAYLIEFSDNKAITMTFLKIAEKHGYHITDQKFALTRVE